MTSNGNEQRKRKMRQVIAAVSVRGVRNGENKKFHKLQSSADADNK